MFSDMLPMQSQAGFVGNQNMLGSINPMLQLQSGMQLPNRLALPGQIQMPLPQHAQQHAAQLQQQALMHAQQALGPQLNAPQGNVQQQMLAAQGAQMDPSSSVYFNMYGGLYGLQ